MKTYHQSYRQGIFHLEGVSLLKVANKVGTPFYIYSQTEMEDAFRAYESAFQSIPHSICFALKANSNLAIGRILSRLGAGADVVSGGELEKALLAGFSPEKIVFSGVGKTEDELAYAIRCELRLINVESQEELAVIGKLARRMKKIARISLRVNPDVRAGGHPHVSTGTPENKFGVYYKQIFPLYQWAAREPYLEPHGIQTHIGSQITRVGPYARALQVLLDLVDRLERDHIRLDIIDLGGGLGVDYNGEDPDCPKHLAGVLIPKLRGRSQTLFLEPGRSLVAQAGILVTKVLYRKDAGHKHFLIVDAGMNDLARPALYDAYHEIVPVKKTRGAHITADVVGPVCESGDYLARGRKLPMPEQGDLLAVCTAGAYGFSMSSQYNSRPRVPEVLVKGANFTQIRRRETFEDLVKQEAGAGRPFE